MKKIVALGAFAALAIGCGSAGGGTATGFRAIVAADDQPFRWRLRHAANVQRAQD